MANEEPDPLAGLGERVRRLRTAHGLSQQQLATHSGVSEAHVSRLEGGTRLPSLQVLARIAEGLDVALADLFAEERPGSPALVQRGDQAPTVRVDGGTMQVLTPAAVTLGLYAARYVIEPDAPDRGPVRHEGRNWLYVLRGRLRIDFEQESFRLRAGDGAAVDATRPHRLTAEGNRAVEFLAVGRTHDY
ncbi:helix-turn-helix domain-containing protein [Streptomyces sp. NPDC052396]|uniref:helix-turn-helix domain-containing protein n=1 Tax=Streptomyces sp. NPDC052396 TaxID=3365689 RepID=UPI0037D1991E